MKSRSLLSLTGAGSLMLACAGFVFTGIELVSPYFLPASVPTGWIVLAFLFFSVASGGAARSVAIREENPALAWRYLSCTAPVLLAACVTCSCIIAFWR